MICLLAFRDARLYLSEVHSAAAATDNVKSAVAERGSNDFFFFYGVDHSYALTNLADSHACDQDRNALYRLPYSHLPSFRAALDALLKTWTPLSASCGSGLWFFRKALAQYFHVVATSAACLRVL